MSTQERLVEIHVLETQGLSIRAIGRKLDVSRNTVRRYLRNRCLKPQYPCREVKPTKLDPFKGGMLRRIDAAKPHWIKATVMLVEIKARDYEGGYSQLKCFLRPFKVKYHDSVVHFETLPGKQMQVDFTYISRGGCRIKGFVATLGFSRSSDVVFSAQERQED
jgi:transposase